MPLGRLTRLQAINQMLATIGEAPVDTLTEGGVDIAIAEATLDNVSRETMNFGWVFNTYSTTYVPDSDGYITIPSNVLRLEGPEGSRYVLRSDRLYDLEDDTNVFTSNITLTIVEMLEFDDMPEACKTYVTLKASRVFADRQLGDNQLAAYSRQEEQNAWADLRKEDLKTRKVVIHGPGDRRILRRGTPINDLRSM